jgi:HPt (histidine-containing phosphotransfer) domain-containing protein
MHRTSNSDPAIDEAALLNSVGGDVGFLCELIELFLAACPTLLSQMRQSLAINDFVKLRRAARTLTSSLHYFAFESGQKAVKVLDKAACQHEAAAVAEAFRALEEQIESFTSALSDLNDLLALRQISWLN